MREQMIEPENPDEKPKRRSVPSAIVDELDPPPIFGGKANFIRGHIIGSRYFNNVKITSDWDYLFEDTPELRVFLRSCGWVCRSEYKPGERGQTTSFWQHSTHSCEAFLVKVEKDRRIARVMMRAFKRCGFWVSKKHRWDAWHACEHFVLTIRAIFSDFDKHRSKMLTLPYKRRQEVVQPKPPYRSK